MSKTATTVPGSRDRSSLTEQERFAQRLNQALDEARYQHAGASRIAREFNLRFPDKAVTVHAVRKWIKGEAIPTQDKLLALAQWLGVRADWLRYNGAEPAIDSPYPSHPSGFNGEELRLLRDFQRLSSERKHIVEQIIQLLLRST
jgi:transcriptional regulator with XRE-family HTH domain